MIDYSKINLSEEEKEAAILEGQKRKYFREKHKEYWYEQENKSGKTKRDRVEKKSD